MQKFCLITTGRTGSSSFFNALRRFDDIRIPSYGGGCDTAELIHPLYMPLFAATYSQADIDRLPEKLELINDFYKYSDGKQFAGFKLLYSQLVEVESFLEREDVQFFVLLRKDIPSHMASQMMATDTGLWGRTGGPHTRSWNYAPQRKPGLTAALLNLKKAFNTFEGVKNAHVFYYEDLAGEGFFFDELDAFFGRHICLDEPKSPTSGAQYVGNWNYFRDEVTALWDECCKVV